MRFVLDGAKALHAALTRIWGKDAVIHRINSCKRRTVHARFPESHQAKLGRRLAEACHETGYATPKVSLEAVSEVAGADHPGCGVEPAGGLGETPTVARLGV